MTLISRLRSGALALLVAVSCSAVAATVTGTVTNKTVNKPSGGDDVVLIAFGQGMQEAGRTKTDAKGHYSIEVPDNGMHLIRVDHQKAAYFQPLRPGSTSADVDVYDVLPKVEDALTRATADGISDAHALRQLTRRVIGKWVSDSYRRRPMIIPVVVEV